MSPKPAPFTLWIMDIRLEVVLRILKRICYPGTMPHRAIIPKNNFHISICFIFLPHLSTPVPFPQVPRGDFRTRTHYTSLRLCMTLGNGKSTPFTQRHRTFSFKDLSFKKSPVFSSQRKINIIKENKCSYYTHFNTPCLIEIYICMKYSSHFPLQCDFLWLPV